MSKLDIDPNFELKDDPEAVKYHNENFFGSLLVAFMIAYIATYMFCILMNYLYGTF